MLDTVTASAEREAGCWMLEVGCWMSSLRGQSPKQGADEAVDFIN
jgi:hypothetical protein